MKVWLSVICYDLSKINTNNFQILKIMPTFEKKYNQSLRKHDKRRATYIYIKCINAAQFYLGNRLGGAT